MPGPLLASPISARSRALTPNNIQQSPCLTGVLHNANLGGGGSGILCEGADFRAAT